MGGQPAGDASIRDALRSDGGKDGIGRGPDAVDLPADAAPTFRDGGPVDANGTGSPEGGAVVCDESAPPANVAAWIDESWTAEGRNNITSHKNWMSDSVILGKGQVNVCVRYGATRAVTPATRDAIAPAMQRWFNKWITLLSPYDCFPYPSIAVKISGWAVKPGQESVLQWTDRTVPVYTEVSDGSDQAKGEPKCPDACGFFFHPDHVFTGCPGGADNHFDYTLWLDDTLPSGNTAEGSDWGVRMPVATLLNDLTTDAFWVMLHEMGHAFALSDYYSWKGSTPAGGSIMMIGSSNGLTVGDQWMLRRYWKETRALRYPQLVP
jgi:hypothetical protein